MLRRVGSNPTPIMVFSPDGSGCVSFCIVIVLPWLEYEHRWWCRNAVRCDVRKGVSAMVSLLAK